MIWCGGGCGGRGRILEEENAVFAEMPERKLIENVIWDFRNTRANVWSLFLL